MNPSSERKRFRDQPASSVIWQGLLSILGGRASALKVEAAEAGDADAPAKPEAPARLAAARSRPVSWLVAVALIAVVVYSVASVRSSGSSSPPVPQATRVPTVPPLVAPPGPLLVPSATFGGSGSAALRLSQPQDALFGADGRIYIADTGNHRVVILNAKGKQTGVITQGTNAPLQAPFGLALAQNGDLLVLDSDAGAVFEYDAQGNAVGSTDASSSLAHARGIAVDPFGRVLVADPASEAVYTFSSSLQLTGIQQNIGPNGAELFDQPSTIATSPTHSIIVDDSQVGQIDLYSPAWQLLQSWAVPTPDTLHSPHVVALADGNVLITDPADGKLLLFKAGAAQPLAYSVPGGAAAVPLGVAIDSHGNVLLTCNGLNDVIEVQLSGL
jgi:DNA-binding beta-propeller fold protein YncE